MDARRLRYFVAVADHLHFGRAAVQLGLSQPPLSQQIRLLENELGFDLFERSTRQVQLTEAGQLFLPEARAAVEQAEAATETGKRIARGHIGELRLGMTTSTPMVAASAGIIAAFHRRYPDVALSVSEMGSARQIEAIQARHLHAGVLRLAGDATPDAAGIDALLIDREPLAVFLSEDHWLATQAPIAIADLCDQDFVMFSKAARSLLRDQVFICCQQAGFSPKIAQEAREAVMLCGLAAIGLGVAILPQSFRHIGAAGLVMRPIAGAAPQLATWIAWSTDNSAPVLRHFIDVVRSEGPA